LKKSIQIRAGGSPERLADALLGRIFRGDFPPNTRLPPERQLAAELGVDRTTLRMALKQLQRMRLLTPLHGSGIVVNDFKTHGGLDVLAALFSIDDLPLEGSFIVEGLDFWLEIFCMTAAKGIVRMGLDDMRRIEQLLDRASAAGKDLDATVEAVVELQDALASLSGSVIFQMLNNSTRSLRMRLVRLLHETADVKKSMDSMRLMLRTSAVVKPSEETIRNQLLAAFRSMTSELRERLLFGPPMGAAPKKSRRKKS
jgi:GntR family transcriptional regulator, transcriptional repressor for pyruvate dehydrogenase complex